MKKINLKILLGILAAMLILSVPVIAEDYMDPEIPENWYKDPATASEMGITEFSQSPMLKERVENGTLPPLEKRLPNDPPVLIPYGNNTGEYGGTLIGWDRMPFYAGENWLNPTWGTRVTPDGYKQPWIFKGWDYSNNDKTFTLYLRKGLKWSNGDEFTADDFVYAWEHEYNNKKLHPSPPENMSPPLLNVKQVDKWTVRFEFGKPNPTAHVMHIRYLGPGMFRVTGSADFKKQFHPDFAGKKEIEKMAQEAGFDTWDGLYSQLEAYWSYQGPPQDEKYLTPVVTPFVPVEITDTYALFERNPYYPFVDNEGQQLPYIDKLRINLANNAEMAATKAIMGEADWYNRALDISKIPMSLKNEKKENYTTHIYQRTDISGLNLNLTHKNPEIRNIYQDLRFRKAISFAINRENINQKIYFGKAKPMQITIIPPNDVFKEKYAQAFVKYDPEKSRELLDEIGMVDKDGDGYRELPSGKKYQPTLTYAYDNETPRLELIRTNLKEIGINIQLKMLKRELHNERAAANELDITPGDAGKSFGAWTERMYGLRAFAPINTHPGYSPWPAWVTWYSSNGEGGMEPPQFAKELRKYVETVASASTEEERKAALEKLVKEQAENIWSIGIVGLQPNPVIVKNNLKNMPKKGISEGMHNLMRVEQLYFEKE